MTEPNLIKQRARKAVARAIKKGILTRPDNCSRCGKCSSTKAHHEDYSKPLEVEWLCSSCHVFIHQDSKSYIIQAGVRYIFTSPTTSPPLKVPRSLFVHY